MQDKRQEYLTKLESATGEAEHQQRREAVDVVGVVGFGTHPGNTNTHLVHTPSIVWKDLMMTAQDAPEEHQFVAIPRHPKLDDVHAYMEFLAREHPDLHTAIVYAELAYANAGQNFNPESRALDELGKD